MRCWCVAEDHLFWSLKFDADITIGDRVPYVASCGQRIGAYIGLNRWMPLQTQIAQCYALEDLAELLKVRLRLEIPLATEITLNTWYTGFAMSHYG